MDPAVTGALVGAGGAVIVAVAGFFANIRNTRATTAVSQRAVEAAQRTVEVTEQGQVTDRYTKAIDQLGSDKQLAVRIGGIYALERIASDSPRDHPTIMEVLAVFIREHFHEQWPLAEPGTEPSERTPRPDVQAALTVIGRRDARCDSRPIDLSGAELTGAKIPRHAGLAKAKLSHAVFTCVDLTEQSLSGADLTRADLTKATLIDAKLRSADLSDAERTDAKRTEAGPIAANLTGAILTCADLTGAILTDAVLDGVDFTGAFWPSAATVPEGWQRDSDSGRLKRAEPMQTARQLTSHASDHLDANYRRIRRWRDFGS
jgi:hypothetical protein